MYCPLKQPPSFKLKVFFFNLLMDGFDYEGYYHIQDDGVAYTEPTFVQGKSQVLVPKEILNSYKESYSN